MAAHGMTHKARLRAEEGLDQVGSPCQNPTSGVSRLRQGTRLMALSGVSSQLVPATPRPISVSSLRPPCSATAHNALNPLPGLLCHSAPLPSHPSPPTGTQMG